MSDSGARRIEVVNKIRGWVGTPFRHQGRLKGRGVDCIGLVLAAADELGAISEAQRSEIPNYGRIPYKDSMGSFMRRHLIQIDAKQAKPLDIVFISIYGHPMHVGLLTDYARHGRAEPPLGLIHASTDLRTVSEQRWDPTKWSVNGYFRFPELVD